MKTIRLLVLGWYFQFKMISRSAFEGSGQVIWPLFFATVAFFVFRAGDSPRTLLYASLGRRGDGHVVGDKHDRRRGDAAGALARAVVRLLRRVQLSRSIGLPSRTCPRSATSP
jgi:hypothetical protein